MRTGAPGKFQSDRPAPLVDVGGLRVHMIGIGGSGMSGLARMLLTMGATVTGTDAVAFEGMGDLVEHGARVSTGHRDALLGGDVELVVISAAIPESNPELVLARSRGVPIKKYAELLGALVAAQEGVAIAGTHGKSTTTGLTAHLFRSSGLAPSFVLGARCDQLDGSSSGVGSGPHFVVESCEFDRSFLHMWSKFGAILNIEPDHLDCYADDNALFAAFADFARQVDSNGVLIVNAADEQACIAGNAATACVERFSHTDKADWCAVDLRPTLGCYSFEVSYHGKHLLAAKLSFPGIYNVDNALAAIALAYHAGADPQRIADALPAFTGVERRMTWRGRGRGVDILDDYAHHPTEIRVTLHAARSRYQPKRTWVIFQPHQCSRTVYLMDAFADSFAEADEIIVPSVYGAREADPEECASRSRELVDRIRDRGGRARYVSSLLAAAQIVVENAAEGDLIMTMGAGDVWKVADELVARIC